MRIDKIIDGGLMNIVYCCTNCDNEVTDYLTLGMGDYENPSA